MEVSLRHFDNRRFLSRSEESKCITLFVNSTLRVTGILDDRVTYFSFYFSLFRFISDMDASSSCAVNQRYKHSSQHCQHCECHGHKSKALIHKTDFLKACLRVIKQSLCELIAGKHPGEIMAVNQLFSLLDYRIMETVLSVSMVTRPVSHYSSLFMTLQYGDHIEDENKYTLFMLLDKRECTAELFILLQQ